MGYHATTWAWAQDVGNPVRKMILLHISQAANPEQNNNETWHSYDTIRKACNCSRGSVHNHIKWLLDNDYLTLIRQSTRAGETNRYRLNVGHIEVQAGPSRTGDERPVQEMNEDGSSGVPDGSSGVPDGSSGVHKPVIQPVKEPVSKTDRRNIPKPLKEKFNPPSSIPLDRWGHYLESRREKKHPMNAGALALCVQAIEKTISSGVPVHQIMDKMIEAGWRSCDPKWFGVSPQRNANEPTGNEALAARVAAEMRAKMAGALQ